MLMRFIVSLMFAKLAHSSRCRSQAKEAPPKTGGVVELISAAERVLARFNSKKTYF